MPTDPNAQKVIDACKTNWEAHKSDCSGFAKAVAMALEITGLTGQANDIYAELLGKEWTELTDGVEAKAKADAGMFVLAALTGIKHIDVILSPMDFRTHEIPATQSDSPDWLDTLYLKLRDELEKYPAHPAV